MNVELKLSAAAEAAARRRAAQAGVDIATWLTDVVTEELTDESSTEEPSKIATTNDFADWQAAWIALHPVLAKPIDDSRESIYAGREE